MSFKIKKWGNWGTITATDHYADFAHTVNINPERQHLGNTFMWRGHVVFCGYEATSKDAIWMHFDPMTNQWYGPYPAPAFVDNYWRWHSGFYGNDRNFYYYPGAYVVCGLLQAISAAPYFYYLSDDFEWIDCLGGWTFPDGSTNHQEWLIDSAGSAEGGRPVMLLLASHGAGVSVVYDIWQLGMNGAQHLKSASYSDQFAFRNSWGSIYFKGYAYDDVYQWTSDSINITGSHPAWPLAGWNLYSQPPRKSEYSSPLAHAMVLHPQHFDGGTMLEVRQKQMTESGQYYEPYHAFAADIDTAVVPLSAWEIIRSREGVPWVQLDQRDLDGRSHGAVLPIDSEVTYHPEWGHFVSGYLAGGTATIYALDPRQPKGRPRSRKVLGSEAVAWVGEYAIREKLVLDHVLPLPDDRAPVGSPAMPPQETRDKYILSSQEIFKRQGAKIAYKRKVLSDFRSYPYVSDDWWFPGMVNGRLDHLLELFAGNSSIVSGRMPDSMFGMYGPLGNDVRYGLGLPLQNLGAPDGDPTHTYSHGRMIAGTNFASPIVGGVSELRRQLLCSMQDDRFTYTEVGNRILSIPHWHAKGGLINEEKQTWTTLVDFESIGRPHLGETDWVVRSLLPIPRCSALPKGGWLVGATLYFAPWEKDAWEWDPGTRDATFRNTGKGWLPAIPGFDGPFQNDFHAPQYLVGADPFDANRSLYGPDALLVYDIDGKFVECLNSDHLYAPDANEVVVTTHRRPRVIFRIYRHGTYSDSAEGWGQYHRLATDEEIQAPLYVCYDLYGASNKIEPGAGMFRGFVDMHVVGDHSPRPAEWRWTLPPMLYSWQYPKRQWSPPGQAYIRAGLGGRQVVPLHPGPTSARGGLKGSAHHARV